MKRPKAAVLGLALAGMVLAFVPTGAAGEWNPPMPEDPLPEASTPSCVFIEEEIIYPDPQSVVNPGHVIEQYASPGVPTDVPRFLEVQPEDGFVLDLLPETRFVYLDFRGTVGGETPEGDDDGFRYLVTGSSSYGCGLESTIEYLIGKILPDCLLSHLPCPWQVDVYNPTSRPGSDEDPWAPLLGAGAS